MSTRAELKENILASQLEVIVAWVVNNRSKVLPAAGIAVGAILIGSVALLRRRENFERNWTRLAQAQMLLAQQQVPTAKQILQEVRSSSPNTPLYYHAGYLLAEAAFAEPRYVEAEKNLLEVTEKGGGSLKPLALSNLAFAYEQKKDYSSSAQTYQRFLEKHGDHFLAPRAQLGMGRSYLMAGNQEQGKKALEQLIDLYPTSDWAENARSLLDKNVSR